MANCIIARRVGFEKCPIPCEELIVKWLLIEVGSLLKKTVTTNIKIYKELQHREIINNFSYTMLKVT